MFSLFSTPIYAPQEPTFNPLFRLLDDFDNYSREVEQTQCRPQAAVSCPARRVHRHPQATRALNTTTTSATFKPKFDVRETETTYELHGELPGIDRDNLHIEFTDPQTLVVRGRVERTYETKPEEEETEKTETVPEPEPEATPSEAGSTGSSSHHATVEDAPEDDDEDWEKATTTSVASATATPAVTETPKTETPKTEVAKPVEKPAEVQKAAPAQKAQRYWLYERSIGEFSRTFNFPARVEQEGVSATLDNGVLNVTVPKAKRHQARRIAIF